MIVREQRERWKLTFHLCGFMMEDLRRKEESSS
jgi:hypothetical protein